MNATTIDTSAATDGDAATAAEQHTVRMKAGGA